MATKYQIISWRDIPAQVKVVSGRTRVGRPLSKRFPVAIDEAAMRAGLTESDAYLAAWQVGEWHERDGAIEEVADDLAAELEAAYPPERLRSLIEQQGLEKEEE